MKYKVGDKVRIVKKWCGDGFENKEGKMDKYLGTVMTIREIIDRSDVYKMEEDKHEYLFGWNWRENMIEGYADGDKIVIACNGNKVKAQLLSGKKCIKKATAKCNPEDEFSFEKGAKLAVDRLFEEKPKTCPFCGGKAEVARDPHAIFSMGYVVKCEDCYARSVSKPTEQEAIKAWNKREG